MNKFNLQIKPALPGAAMHEDWAVTETFSNDDSNDVSTYHDFFWQQNLTWCYTSSGVMQWNVSIFNLLCINSSDDHLPPVVDPLNYWAIVLVMFPLLTVFGNSLVVLSVVKEKTLRTVTNYFIVSLATSDIMVAMLVMPLSIYSEVIIRVHL